MGLKQFLFYPYAPFSRIVFLLLFLLICSGSSSVFAQQEEDYKILREIILNEFKDHKPTQRGGEFAEVKLKFSAADKKIAVSMAACLDMGAEADWVLMNKLLARKIPFSIFTDKAWLEQNIDQLKPILESGLVHFENHGSFCRALSVDGQVSGEASKTTSLEEVFEEIEDNARAIERFSGRLPRFYRSGQGYYDDVALKIVNVLGYQVVEGDLKLKAKDVESDETMQLFSKKIQLGSILFIPANRPGTSEKWADKLVDKIKQAGFTIIALDDAVGVDEEEI